MERDGTREASGRHSNRVIGFASASLVAPIMTVVAMLVISTISDPAFDVVMPADWKQFIGVSATAVVLIVAGSLTFGMFGSGVLLGATFGLAALVMRGRARTRWPHYVFAGALAGALHVGLAGWSTQGWPPGPGVLLGTWLLGRALETGEFALALAPIIGGAVAGLIYARMRTAPDWRR